MSGDIEIVIGAQDKASAIIDSVASKVGGFSSSFAMLGPVAAGVGAAIAATAAGFLSLSAAMDSVSEAADRIDALTDKAAGLGESVTKLQAFQFAMEEAGNVDAEKSIQALQKIQKVVGEVASGDGAGAGEVFAKLGIDANALSMQSPIDQFMALKEGIAGIENVSERAAVAQQLLGKSAADLIPALISGQEEFTASMQAAQDFGLTVSEQGAAGIASMNDALGRVYAGFEGLANQVAVALAPAVEVVANQLAKWLPPIIELAQMYLPAAVEVMVQMVGHAYDFATTMYKLSTLDFAGAWADATDGISTADTMLNEVYAARDRAAQTALENIEKQKALAAANKEIDEAAIRAEEQKAAAAAKTIEQLERQLDVAQMGEELIKQQEQLATATNDAERERIQLLQEQIAQQEQLNAEVESQKRADEEATKQRQKDMEDAAKDAQDKASKMASFQPGTQATESRLLTRGPAEKGIDKIANNTEKSKTLLEQIRDKLGVGTGEQLQFEVVS